jgi:hypothetical protein
MPVLALPLGAIEGVGIGTVVDTERDTRGTM